MPKLIAALALLLATSSCSLLDDPIECDLILVPGFIVTVVDSLTDQTLPATSEVIVIATDGAYADTSYQYQHAPSFPIYVVKDRPGTYTLKVLSKSHTPWIKQGIRVTGDECHVRSIDITARLQK